MQTAQSAGPVHAAPSGTEQVPLLELAQPSLSHEKQRPLEHHWSPWQAEPAANPGTHCPDAPSADARQ